MLVCCVCIRVCGYGQPGVELNTATINNIQVILPTHGNLWNLMFEIGDDTNKLFYVVSRALEFYQYHLPKGDASFKHDLSKGDTALFIAKNSEGAYWVGTISNPDYTSVMIRVPGSAANAETVKRALAAGHNNPEWKQWEIPGGWDSFHIHGIFHREGILLFRTTEKGDIEVGLMEMKGL